MIGEEVLLDGGDLYKKVFPAGWRSATFDTESIVLRKVRNIRSI